MGDLRKDSSQMPGCTPGEDGAQPSSPNSRSLRFGRGVYGSKDVPIRALDACIAVMIVLCIALTAWNSIHGGFVISFDVAGADAAVATQSVRYGKLVAQPEAPVRPGYDLKGWSTSAEAYVPWEFQTSTVTGDMTLYAVWKPAAVTVKFDLNGGSYHGAGSIEAASVTFGEPYGTLPVPVKEGYTFAGWFYSGGQITAETTVAVNGEHVLTAAWK